MIKLERFIRDIPDFPKKGIVYKDITPLLANAEAMEFALESFLKKLPEGKIDKVVGIESRGFFFATLLAQKLNAGFVPIRKKGKLPHNTHNEVYSLEYGSDELEIHEDAVLQDENVLIHDDVLATGGTAAAACRLVEKCGGKIVQCNFLVALSFLQGDMQLKNYEIKSLIRY